MNYQIALEEKLHQISAEGHLPKLLLHSCCAPCSSYVVSFLMEYFDITVFYYNPNIYPQKEYEHRKAEQIRLLEELNRTGQLAYELNGCEIVRQRKAELKFAELPYNHLEFLEQVKDLEEEPEGGRRCDACFRLRLGQTFDYARMHGFSYFATTLSVSPHKNAVLLNEIGEGFSEPPVYLVSDFKKKEGYKVSITLSRQFDLYRQIYCGCEFSLNA